jgi:hypothetical protein
MEQKASQRPHVSPCTGRLKGRATRRRLSQSASQSEGEAAAQARTVQSAQEWRQYAGNGTFISTLVAAACDGNSCSHNPQSDKSSHTECTTMITDATIKAAKEAAESSELKLKSLSEALDRLKVRLPTYN